MKTLDRTKKYSIVFSDLDGTLLNSEHHLSEVTAQMIERLNKKGIIFVPSTGRQVRSLPDEVKNNPYIKYAITSNGVEIFDVQEKKTVSKIYMPKGIVKDFFKLCEELGNPAMEIYYRGAAYVVKDYYDDPAKYNNPRVEYVQSTRTVVPDLLAFALSHDGELDGMTIIAPEGKLEEFAEKVKGRFPNIYVTTADGIYVETANSECGKHKGMERLCRMLGIDLSESIAFGDNENDLDMLRAAGFGVAVSNATENLRNNADYIAPSNDEDGVAKVINELM